MNKNEEATVPLVVQEHCFDKDMNSSEVACIKETVSHVQTETATDQNTEIEYCGVNSSSTPFSPSTFQEKGINKIKRTVIHNASGEGLMNFPPTDTYDPIS
jgi:hypothetical protein